MKRYIVRTVVFSLIFIALYTYLTRMMIPEHFADARWPTTASYQRFYKMEQNSIDVLFLGSSASATSFIPQQLYNMYGIKSYNLSCAQQSLFTSYYWLKEALRFQSPKVVVLEGKMLFSIYPWEALNATEEHIRMAFDSMKWSKVKMEAVRELCRIDSSQTEISYYFPLLRFHSRWKELSEKDFLTYYFAMSGRHELKGYAPISHVSAGEFTPIQDNGSAEYEQTVPIMQEYLDKITALCKNEGITLILTCIPALDETVEKNRTFKQYAEKNGIAFLDYNEESIYNKLKYDYAADNEGEWHANLWGALKLSDHMGQFLTKKCKLNVGEDEQWEKTRQYFENLRKDYELTRIMDMDEYFEALQDSLDRYSIFISVKDEASNHLKDTTIRIMKNMGLQVLLENQYQSSYLAVISDGVTAENAGYELLEREGMIKRSCWYSITSGGFECGNQSSILINGIEYSKNSRGFNIVVYDAEERKIVDQTAFDTFLEDQKAAR